MTDQPQPAAGPAVPSAGVHRTMGLISLVRGIMVLAGAAIALAAVVVLALRLAWPVPGNVDAVIASGVLAAAALVAGTIVSAVISRRARRARTLQAAANVYLLGCILGCAFNLAAGCYTVRTLFTNGVAGGLWLPQTAVVALNVIAVVLTAPRISRFRKLHYSPALPYSRL